MIVLDASVLIAHLNPTDGHHDSATSILLEAAPRSLIVHTLTLAEVLVVGVRIGRGTQLRADLHAAGIRLAEHDDEEPLRLAELRVASGLKLPDCCALDVATVSDSKLATFDHALASAATGRGITILT